MLAFGALHGDTVLAQAAPAASGSQRAASAAASSTINAKDTKTVTTASGLQIEDLAIGQGAEARAGQTVSVHYTGWLKDAAAPGGRGKKFDSSRDRGQPFQFPLGGGRVIKGWDEGVAGMKVGGKRVLTIPPQLGYGARDVGNGLIPPNSTLIFEVELLGL